MLNGRHIRRTVRKPCPRALQEHGRRMRSPPRLEDNPEVRQEASNKILLDCSQNIIDICCSICFTYKSDAIKNHSRSIQTRCQDPSRRRDSPRLSAPSPRPSSFRLHGLCQRRRSPGLGAGHQLPRWSHQADRPPPRDRPHRPAVARQLSKTEGHPGADLRIQPPTAAPRVNSHEQKHVFPVQLRRP